LHGSGDCNCDYTTNKPLFGSQKILSCGAFAQRSAAQCLRDKFCNRWQPTSVFDLWMRFGFSLGILLSIFASRTSATVERLSIDLAPGIQTELSFDLNPEPGAFAREKSAGSEAATIRSFKSKNGYRVRIEPIKQDGTLRFRVRVQRDNREPYKVLLYGLDLSVPSERIRGVWHTQVEVHGSLFQKSLTEAVAFDAAANIGMPFILCAGEGGRNVAAAGWIDQVLLTKVSAQLSQTSGRYMIDLVKTADAKRPLERELLEDAFYIKIDNSYWFDVAQEYAHTVDVARSYRPNPIPTSALQPVYCSWYAYNDDIFEQRIWDNAVICKELGLRTFLIDAGWNTPKGWTWGDPSGPYGDYVPVKSQFPDFAGLIRRMREQLGLTVELWASPFWVGEASAAEKELANAKLRTTQEDYNLCPSHPATAPRLREICVRMIRDYGANGIWMDFMDAIPRSCNAPHEHVAESLGAGFTSCARDMFEAIIHVKRDAIVEYRLQHANLNNKLFANVFETTDTPFDPDTNRLLGIIVRTFGAGMAMKPDPAIWRPEDSDTVAAKSCATMVMGGVPSFSLDLPHLPESHRRILKSWIQFYNDHRDELLRGKFQPFGVDFTCPNVRVDGKTESFVYLKSRSTEDVELGGKKISRLYILNCTDMDSVRVDLVNAPAGHVTAITRDCSLQAKRTRHFHGGARIHLDEQVPQGGAIEVQWQQ
jgi:hypothetical protein